MNRPNYDGTQKSVTVTGVTLDGKALATDDYEVKGATATDAGTYTVTVTGVGNYADTATATWTIVPANMKVSADDVVIEYDGNPHGITVNVSDPANGATVMYGTKLGEYNQTVSPTLTAAGMLVVYYRVTAENYNAYEGYAVVTVERAPFVPTVIIDGWTYGMTPGKPHILDNPSDDVVTYSYCDAAYGDYTETVPTDAGTWYVRAQVAETANYPAVTTEQVSFVITPASISITADDKSSQYENDIQTLTWQIGGDYVQGDDLGITASTTATSTSDVGEYLITLQWNRNPNYTASLTNGKYTITKAPSRSPPAVTAASMTAKPTVSPWMWAAPARWCTMA